MLTLDVHKLNNTPKLQNKGLCVFIATSRGGARELLAEGSGDVMPDVDASLGSRSRSGSGVVEGECVGDFSLARV